MIRKLSILSIFFIFHALGADSFQDSLKKSIVQVKVTYQRNNFIAPWQPKPPKTLGAIGIVTGSKQILVLTNYISDYTLIEIKKHSSYDYFRAKPVKIDYESNLTLLEVEDTDFFSDLKPVEFEKITPLNSPATFCQLDNSGSVQASRGQILGMDMETYPMGSTELPLMDINSNEKLDGSGELIIQKNKVIGMMVEFSGNKNNGKGIPGLVIRQFLRGKSSSIKTNFPFKGFRFRPITDSSTKEYFGLTQKNTGVLVAEIFPYSGAWNALKIDDVILEFGGFKIDSKGFFEHPLYGKQSLAFLAHTGEEFGHGLGRSIPVKVLRDKKEIVISMPLKSFPYESIQIPSANLQGNVPHFMILNGFIFLELSEFLLKEWGNNWRSRVDKKLLSLNDYHKTHKSERKGKIVLLSQVMPDDSNNGYHNLSMKIVTSANGQKPLDVPALNKIIQDSKDELIKLELEDGIDVIIDKAKLKEANEKIKKKFKLGKLKNF